MPLNLNHNHNQNQYPYQYQLGHGENTRGKSGYGQKDVRKTVSSLGVPLKLIPPLHTHSKTTSTARAGLRTGSGEGHSFIEQQRAVDKLKHTGPNWFWTMVWVWCLDDVQLFMRQRDKVLNAPTKHRRYRTSNSRR